jgi:hypothetical protein
MPALHPSVKDGSSNNRISIVIRFANLIVVDDGCLLGCTV